MYLPDAIASYRINGETFLVTANEGDAREWPGLVEEVRVSALTLNPTVFPDGDALKNEDAIGRLTVTSAGANTDGNSTNGVERLLVLGGRSFSIWKPDGTQVFDSGDALRADHRSRLGRANFNSTNDAQPARSIRAATTKGPSLKNVTVGRNLGPVVHVHRARTHRRRDGLRRHPPRRRPVSSTHINHRDFARLAGQRHRGRPGAEGVFVIPQSDSPTQEPLLVVTNEVSGTTSIFALSKAK